MKTTFINGFGHFISKGLYKIYFCETVQEIPFSSLGILVVLELSFLSFAFPGLVAGLDSGLEKAEASHFLASGVVGSSLTGKEMYSEASSLGIRKIRGEYSV